MYDDFRPVPTQEFKAVVCCVNPLREGNDHQRQLFGARLSNVGIKPTLWGNFNEDKRTLKVDLQAHLNNTNNNQFQ